MKLKILPPGYYAYKVISDRFIYVGKGRVMKRRYRIVQAHTRFMPQRRLLWWWSDMCYCSFPTLEEAESVLRRQAAMLNAPRGVVKTLEL